MAEPTVISQDEPINPGLNYFFLKETGTALIQELAGKIWTDYNEHDPGVTTLEQLCYALTELSYRAEFPLPDLLTDYRTGRIDTHRQALFIPRRIFPCNPVTIADYRKLIVDRVPEIGNVWLTTTLDTTCPGTVEGLYDIRLFVPGINNCTTDPDLRPGEIINRVHRVYCRHRDLCEDVASISILEPRQTTVFADVTLTASAAADTVLADLLFNIGLFLAPEIQRRSLKTLLDEDLPSDEIFDGPLLRHGFISNDQLQPKAASIPVRDIVSVIANTTGVASSRDVSVVVQGNPDSYFPEGPPIEVPENVILTLDTTPDRNGGGFSIRLFRNGILCRPDPIRVARELEKRLTEFRRTFPLLPEYEEYFSIPKGELRNLSSYYSIQNQFPNVYGINSYGLPGDVSDRRKGQAKQFKGYLLVFEQLLTDFFAQLAHTRDLYSIQRGIRKTYYFQSLVPSVPDVLPLLKANYLRGLKDIIQSQDPWVERRNRFLDFLLALYAENFSSATLPTLSCEEASGIGTGRKLMRAKIDFLHRLVESTRRRGRGFDYLAPPLPHNIAGLQIKSRIQLDFEIRTMTPLGDFLDEFAVEIVEDDSRASLGRAMGRHTEHIESQFQPIRPGSKKKSTKAETPAESTPSLGFIRGQSVAIDFLQAAERIENYGIGILPNDRSVALVCKAPGDHEWRLASKFSDFESAEAAGRDLAEFMGKLKARCEQLYIVEHTLLRSGCRHEADSPGVEDGDVLGSSTASETAGQFKKPVDDFSYSFTITAILSGTAAQLANPDFKNAAREIIRENTPAHIMVEFCFLGFARLRRFESLYWEWRRALRNGQTGSIRETSIRMRRFLENCRCREENLGTERP
jgi:hypothetical protein